MIKVVSIKFKNRGKSYFFDPGELQLRNGDKVIVETSKGLEIADCCYGNHAVPDTAVVPPLRPVIRKATEEDLKIAEANEIREKEAFAICQKKIVEHELDMKLVEVECSFEGNKLLFFFTSDGRVDFRELVKDLASIFRSRIELRQIGVRDEAKMIGGIAICGRPYCCSQFLDGFQPVSTKMAKVQSLSLNPTKISGSCGRLMCCLRYEEEAYEDLLKNVPKQGAFVQTKDGYGVAMQINLLRQTVKVKLDSDTDDTLRLFKSNELAVVPGGRPKEGEELPNVLCYVPPVEEEAVEEVENNWSIPFAEEKPEAVEVAVSKGRRQRRQRHSNAGGESAAKPEKRAKPDRQEKRERPPVEEKSAGKPEQPVKGENGERTEKREQGQKRPRNRHKAKTNLPKPERAEEKKLEQKNEAISVKKPVKRGEKPENRPSKRAENAESRAEMKTENVGEVRNENRRRHKPKRNDDISVKAVKLEQPTTVHEGGEEQHRAAKPRNNRRRYHNNKPRTSGNPETHKE